MSPRTWPVLAAALFVTTSALAHDDASTSSNDETHMRFVQIAAKSKQDRSAIADQGVSIEAIRTDSVWGFAHENALKRLRQGGFQVLGEFDYRVGRGGHDSFDFPSEDTRFHNYAETMAVLKNLNSKHADITRLHVIGKSLEGRDITAIQINTTPESLQAGKSNKPGAIFMGAHHAREHLSVEVPLMLAEYLLNNRGDAKIGALLDARDIWIIPMVNPDGAEWDINTGKYKWWRKNRRNNGNGTYGVDLNRNYGFKWGTGGSDKDPASDVYMGTEPFSEPETKTIRDFVEAHLNAKVLLSFHTFSELVLYPWGHTYDAVGVAKDLQVFETMAKTMAQWNKYKPQQSSALYIASGDTTDWAYGAHGIFAFTFELSPSSMWDGGFYPGQGVIDRVFQDNLQPCLYMIDVANDPYRVVGQSPSGWLKNYVEPGISPAMMWERHPI